MTMELLAPAGTYESLVAAVQNGANAVYLGAQALNARAGAGNFGPDELCRAADYAHERGVKIHVTVNTMVRQDEMKLLDDVARQLARAGVDAAIVQDFGVAAQLRERLPSLSLHASTQMAVHNRQGAELCREMGFDRVVLAREMSYQEIGECAGLGIETEAFVHGALCVACSGQCLMSSLVGGRSGNRGQCAQPCRLPWRLDGAVKAGGYLLSTRDLQSLNGLMALREAGVSSLKIEGRLKRPEYVATVTKVYREALDILESYDEYEADEDALKELRQIFNRGGFTQGYGPGAVDKEIMYSLRPNNIGVEAGRVQKGRILLLDDVENGDVLALRGRDGTDIPLKSLSGAAGQTVPVPLPKEAGEGAIVYRLSSEAQLRAARESVNGEHRKDYIAGMLFAHVGQPMKIVVADGERSVVKEGGIVEKATGKPADLARIRTQLEKTGSTPYEFLDLSLDVEADAFLPASALNELRRLALSELSGLRMKERRGCENRLKPETPVEDEEPKAEETRLSVQSADMEVLKRAGKWGADRLVYAPEDITDEGLEQAAAHGLRVTLALPYVVPSDALDRLNGWTWKYEDLIEGVIVQNVGQMIMEWPGEVQAGEGLNLANRAALKQVRGMHCGDYTPSVELNCGQLREMDQGGGARELVVYGRLQLMLLRHCPIRARNNGAHDACHRCDAVSDEEKMNAHALIDRRETRFPLRRQKTPGGCIVKVMNSVPLCLLKRGGKLPNAKGWRVILTDESIGQAEAIVRIHRMALDGENVRECREWELIEEMQTTTGHYFRGVE
ncbi:MAG: U32 family peptidase [Clostridia bacterium]|nr:U32 family peptidase [Clostridia bacterium]